MSKFLDKTGLDTFWAKIKSTFQTLGNLVTAWGSTPSDTKYPSEKLVKTSLDAKAPNAVTTDVAMAHGDKLLFSDVSDSGKIKRSSTGFDTGLTDTYLCRNGSFGSVKESDVRWGGSFRQELSPIEFGNMARNLIHNPLDTAITFEKTTDGGTTWVLQNITDNLKRALCNIAGDGAGANFAIPSSAYAGVSDPSLLKGRITVYAISSPSVTTPEDTWFYGIVKRVLTKVSRSGTAKMKVEWQTWPHFIAADNTWGDSGTFDIAGDSGWNSVPFEQRIGGYQGQLESGRIIALRFTFWIDAGTSPRIAIINLGFLPQIHWKSRGGNIPLIGVPVTVQNDGTGVIEFSRKLATARKLKTNLARTADSTFDGSADQTNIPVTGTLPVGNGGTGKTSVTAGNYLVGNGTSALTEKTPNVAANDLINALSTGESTPTGEDYYVAQYAGGGTTTKTYHRRPVKALWEYIKAQISSVLGLTATAYGGNAATATKATQDSDGNAINATYFKSSGNTTLVAGAATKIGTQNGADVKLTLPTIPAAVRVKGDAESSYRTGDVNLTPANIGLTDAAIRGKISAGTDLSYDSSTGVMKVNTTGAATGNYAFVSGLATTASGNYSNAEGYKTTASSTSSHAEGSQTTASTPAAHAEGYKTTASGISSHAEGYRDDGDEFAGFSVASGFGSHIEGIDTKASDDASHAEGYLTESSGPHAHAEGESTVASGKDSHAEGLWSTASGLNSHAENSSFAYGENAHSEGYGQSSWGAVGVASHTEGSAAFAYGMSAHAEGGGTNALGKDSHAEGLGGGYRPIAITLTANHVAETSTFTGSTEGLSVGMYLLWKDDAHLTQQVSKITWVGNGTFGTQATFDSAIPAGTVVYAVDRGVAAGAASHVEGFGTSAVGTYAHAEGYLTKAIGEASHAEGQGTEARTGGMHAAGMYPATKEGFARVTGWGSAAAPKDIERLSTQGTLWVGGHFYGATPLKVVPGQTTYDEIYEAWSEQRPFVIEVSMLTHMAHAIYAPATIRAVPLDQAMDHWEFHFRVDYPYNYRAAFYAGGQEPYKVSVYYLAINEQQGWGKLVSGSNEWASLSDSRWYSVPVEYAALAETATEAQNAAANSPLASAISGKSDVGHKHPISDLTMGILPASLGGTGYNNLSDACSATLKAVTLGTDTTMYADDEIMGSNHTSGATDTSKFVRRKASTMKAYVLNGGAMTGQFTNSYQGYGYQASHGTSNKYVGFKAYREDTQVGVSLEVGSNGTVHGVYSSKLGTWIISEKNDSKIHIFNDRLIINSAGALRGSDGVVVITNAAENAGGVLSVGALRQTSFISKSDTFEVTNTDATVRGDGQLYFYRNTNATSAILAKWHVNSASTFATGYIQPGCTGVFQLTNNTNNYFTRLS